ncbi:MULTISPECIES: hypothetical protein [Rhizobium/Agrobacterium group]|jgi:hypothetical protein|uniref:hypothetical protein n=1 Tax=Rhizobium/Agrobacterium group TaxID=227290 RepID=UPI0008A7FB41|nr:MULTISPECIES: hypothetical protein [Rhizobium/Agrobacterium group]NSY19638.1 hypothetical protein [Neorhizobium sp. AL 9.2.2]SEH26899.1 hypothetical protein SAMN03159407_3193 [Rhizobium sp. NFR12]
MVTLTTVLRSGGRYEPIWVERLARGARRHIAGLDRIVCITDFDEAMDGVETVKFRHDWPKWWSKFEAFRPELSDDVNILCDLDTIFMSSASELASKGDAVVMEDHFLKSRASTALMRWNKDDFSFLYERFKRDPDHWIAPGSCGTVPNSVHGDQVVVDHFLRDQQPFPGFIQNEYPDLLDFYDPVRKNSGPVLIFIGDSKPDNATADVKDAWLNS